MDVHEDTDVIPQIRYYCRTLKQEDIRWCTGCLKKTWTFFENAITPSFIEETFPNFLWL